MTRHNHHPETLSSATNATTTAQYATALSPGDPSAAPGSAGEPKTPSPDARPPVGCSAPDRKAARLPPTRRVPAIATAPPRASKATLVSPSGPETPTPWGPVM